jgi:predicted RNA methylase
MGMFDDLIPGAKPAAPNFGMFADLVPEDRGDFVRGAKVALGQTMPIIKGVVGLAGATAENALGTDNVAGQLATGVKNWGLKGFQEGMQKLQPLQKDTDELTTAWERAQAGDLGALVDWAQYGLGYAVGQGGEAVGMSLLGGMAGAAMAPGAAPVAGASGAVAGLVAKGAVRDFVIGLIEKAVVKEANNLAQQAAREGTQLAAEQAVKQATRNVAREIGSTGALLAYGGAQELGTIYPEAEAQAAAEGRQLNGEDLARVWGSGLVAGGIEGLTDRLGVQAAMGKVKFPGATTRAGAALGTGLAGAGIEAATEGAQTAIERFGAGQEIASPEGVKDIINSAALGAIGGGAIGAATGAVQGPLEQAIRQPAAEHARAEASFRAIGDAKTVDEAIDAFNGTHVPLVPLPPGLDAEGALTRMERQMQRDQQDMRVWGPAAAVPQAQPGNKAAMTAGFSGEPSATAVEEEPFSDRLLTLRDQLKDSRTRQQIRDTMGPEALNDVLYYAQRADDASLPGATSDRMLALAEAIVGRAVARPITAAPALPAAGAAPQIGMAGKPLAIELDTTPTGTIRVNEQGVAAPETRADVVSLRDRARAMKERRDGMTSQTPKGGEPGAGVLVGDGTLTTAAFPPARAPRQLPGPASVIDDNAHASAESPTNDLPEATAAQARAGNYKLGHDNETFPGLDLSIENPAGSVRRDKENEPPKWETEMSHHYGYIKGTTGFDKDHLDVFVKPGTAAGHTGPVFVVDQYNKDGSFDEHKAMLGFDSEAKAMLAYRDSYEKGWEGGRAITPMSFDQFKAWAFSDAPKRGPLAQKTYQQGNSWVLREKATGKVVMETFDRKKVEALNTEKYEAVPIGEYLASLNDKGDLKAQWRAAVDAGNTDLARQINDQIVAEKAQGERHAPVGERETSGVRAQREEGDAGRQAAEAGGSDRVQREAQGAGQGEEKPAGKTLKERAEAMSAEAPARAAETGKPAAEPAQEASVQPPDPRDDPRLADIRAQSRAYWADKAAPALRAYFAAYRAMTAERLERHHIKPAGEGPTEWLEGWTSRKAAWDGVRKVQTTGIEALSQKGLWPTDDGKGEALRKAMLAAIRALKSAPSYSMDWVRSIESGGDIFGSAAPAQEASAQRPAEWWAAADETARQQMLRSIGREDLADKAGVAKWAWDKLSMALRARIVAKLGKGAPVAAPKPAAAPAAPKPAAPPEAPAKPSHRAVAISAQKLREAGEKLIDEAKADMGRDRLTNTRRRVSMAASAEADAAMREYIGKKMVRLAEAIEADEAPALAGVTTRVQVELLETIRTQAMYEADRKADMSYAQQQNRRGRAMEPNDLNYVQYPTPKWMDGAKETVRERLKTTRKAGVGDLQRMVAREPYPTPEMIAETVRLFGKADADRAFGWHAIEMAARMQRLRRAGINSIEQLRDAVRQFDALSATKAVVDKVKELERALVGNKGIGVDFFPTPKPLAARLVEEAGVAAGMRVLEPSAGNGNIADAIRAAGVEPDVVEVSPALRDILEAKKHTLVGSDFLELKDGGYDRIVMNPPFGGRADVDHVRHAFSLLKPGGRVVAIMSEGTFFGSDKKATEFRDWLDERGISEQLPAGSFLDKTLPATTGVNARMVVIDKPEEAAAPELRANGRRYLVGDDVGVFYPPANGYPDGYVKNGTITAIDGEKVTFKPNGGKEIVVGPDRLQVNLSALLDRREAPQEATHTEPGQEPEPATKPVITEAIQTAAAAKDRKPSEMKADLLKQVDAAIAKAPERDPTIGTTEPRTVSGRIEFTGSRGHLRTGDAAQYAKDKETFVQIHVRQGSDSSWHASFSDEKRGSKAQIFQADGPAAARRSVEAMLARSAVRDGKMTLGEADYVTFDIPGDGKFKVLNERERLAEFRKKVEASPGFKDVMARPTPERVSGDGQPVTTRESGYKTTVKVGSEFGVEGGSGGAKAAVTNMVEEGDFQAAVDYAAAKGIDLDDLKLSKSDRQRLADWTKANGREPTAAEEPAAPAPPPPIADTTNTIREASGVIGEVSNPDNAINPLTPEAMAAMPDGPAAVRWLMKHAKDPAHRDIAGRLKPFIDGSVSMSFVGKGDSIAAAVARRLNGGAAGVAELKSDGTYAIYFHKGKSVNETLVLHELIHAATMKATQGTKNIALRAEMQSLLSAIRRSFIDVEYTSSLDMAQREEAAFFSRVLVNEDELLAYAFSSPTMRRWMSNMNASGKFKKIGEEELREKAERAEPWVDSDLSLWQRFVDLVRSAIGLSKLYRPRLDKLLADRQGRIEAFVEGNRDTDLYTRLDGFLQGAMEAQARESAATPAAASALQIGAFPEPVRKTLADMEARGSGADFKRWLHDLIDDRAEEKAALADEALRRDYFRDYLREEHSIAVRDDGRIEFWRLTSAVRRLIGDSEVVLLHHTASGIEPNIHTEGLRPGMKNVNRRSRDAVFLTTEASGPAVNGYLQAAVQTHGGDRLTLEVVTTLDQLSPDPDDADIRSGATQFITGRVSPDKIIWPERGTDALRDSMESVLAGIRGFNQAAARNAWLDATTSHASNAWFNGVRTQYAKAQNHPSTFGRVFDAVQDYIKDISTFANAAADLAPNILPKLETWRDLRRKDTPRADLDRAGAALWQGTLTDKRVYDSGELAAMGLTPAQQGLYFEAREAIEQSLDDLAKTEIVRLAGKDGEPVAHAALAKSTLNESAALLTDFLRTQAEQQARPELAATAADIDEKVAHIERLKAEGYAPLMRFGRHTLHITAADGTTQFFGMYESRSEANRARRELGQDPEFDGSSFSQGLMSQEAYRLYGGVPVDALELFARATGAEDNAVYQDYLRLTKNNRSALKRLIKRQGIAGFSEDTSRVLASFVTSNARMASGNLHLGVAKRAADDIPKTMGDLKDDAIRLVTYVQDPQEEASALRGLLFTSFIGGSVASAAVNLTQPFTMTLPYLTQFGGIGKATRHLLAAAKVAGTGSATGELGEALAQAEADGIVSPQEIHHLQAEAINGARSPYVKKAAFIWGSLFSLSEQFNRRVTFIAAWNTARENGIADPFAFAEKAVIETQGLYNKGNKPNWARGPIGATVFTFKQFSIHYLEFLTRMWRSGPEGKKAVGAAMAILLLVAGAGGLPFADDLDDLIDTLAQALGYDFSSKKAKRRFIAETLGLGETAADVATRGLSALPGMPIDVSLRMSMGNLIPGTGALLRSNTDRTRDVLEFAGPAGSIAKSAMDAGALALKGDLAGAGMAMAPLAIQNMAKAASMWNTGEYRNTKGEKVMNVDAVDGAMKFVGFQPAQVARESMQAREVQRSIQLAKNVEGEIAAKWAQGLNEKDPAMVAEAKQALADWNAKNQETPMRIGMQQVIQRVRNLQSTRAQRAEKAAPRELRPLVRESFQ